MRKFYLFIIITLVIYYIDYKFNFQNFLIILFYIALLIFFNYKEQQTWKTHFGTFKSVALYTLMYIIAFSIFSNLLIFLIFNDLETVIKIDKYDFYYISRSLLIFPFLEEYVFRGSILPKLIKFTSKKRAVLLVSIGFTVIHLFSNSSLFLVILFSFFISYVYLKTESILLCFVAHILNNFTVLMIFPYLIFNVKIQENKYYIITTIVLCCSLILFSLLKIINYKTIKDVK